MYLLARIAFQMVQMMQQLQQAPPGPNVASEPPLPGAGPPEGAMEPGDGSSPAPAPAPGFVRVCAKCGQLSYFRERCCLNSQCESCLCL